MIRFECDYTEGAHPKILQRLVDTNYVQMPGYGKDDYSQHACQLIRDFCGRTDLDVHLLAGGTQTNVVAISAMLLPYQGVICAENAHINVHEAGAIEATGHKVLALPAKEGKITAAQIQAAVDVQRNDRSFDQVVQPGMVYLSFTTEYGTLYSKAELYEICEVCRSNQLYLYIDGARLGFGLASPQNDLSIADIVACCDMFYIGGTKQGALIGEAVVIVNEQLKKNFRYLLRRHGALMAKGRLLGIQFEVLFEDDLYLSLSRHAVEMGLRLRQVFLTAGIPLRYDSYTNQQFPIFSDTLYQKLEQRYAASYAEQLPDGSHLLRFCTSWATQAEQIEALAADLRSFTDEAR